MLTNMLNQNISFKDILISKISINHNNMIQAHFFILLFNLNSFLTRKSKLTFNMDISTHMINKDASPYKLFKSVTTTGIIGKPFH